MGCLKGQPLRLCPGRPQIPQQRFLCFVGVVVICSVFSDDICGARTTSSKVTVVFDNVKFFRVKELQYEQIELYMQVISNCVIW